MVVLFFFFFLIFWGILHTLFPWWLHQFTFPPTLHWVAFSPYLHLHFLSLWLFHDSQSARCEVVCHCGFALHFLLREALGIGRLWVQSQTLPVLFFQGQYSSYPCTILWKPRWHSDKEKVCLPMQERCRFNPWVGKIPWRRKMVTHSTIYFFWEIPWTEETGGLQSVWVAKSWTQLSTHALMFIHWTTFSQT